MRQKKNKKISTGFTPLEIYSVNKIKKERRKSLTGFTLIELLVALTLFTLIATVITGIFISVSRAQRKVFALQSTQETARYLLESMSKDIRMSKVQFTEVGNYDRETLTIYVKNREQYINFEFGNSTVWRRIAATTTEIEKATPYPLNSSDQVKVTGKFYIDRREEPVRIRVTISLQVEGIKPVPTKKIYLQNTLSPRDY
ncbi:MAG: prepilin-type N-terminal cleavage/methylation domain-containing protein [Patescibacteria group bacterium]|nr:prepilin-type N-terminal cleavage/methylation domain-containing protein [Patescibacteria group bacterium]